LNQKSVKCIFDFSNSQSNTVPGTYTFTSNFQTRHLLAQALDLFERVQVFKIIIRALSIVFIDNKKMTVSVNRKGMKEFVK